MTGSSDFDLLSPLEGIFQIYHSPFFLPLSLPQARKRRLCASEFTLSMFFLTLFQVLSLVLSFVRVLLPRTYTHTPTDVNFRFCLLSLSTHFFLYTCVGSEFVLHSLSIFIIKRVKETGRKMCCLRVLSYESEGERVSDTSFTKLIAIFSIEPHTVVSCTLYRIVLRRSFPLSVFRAVDVCSLILLPCFPLPVKESR